MKTINQRIIVKHSFRFLLIAWFISSIVIFCLSIYYSLSPLYVTELLSRKVYIEAVGLGVMIHDPTQHTETLIGPPLVIAKHNKLYTKQKELLARIRSMFPGKVINIDLWNNKQLKYSKYKFSYQPSSDSRIANLRKVYGIEKFILPQDNDFDQLTALANWVNRQWLHGNTGKFDPTYFDANTILIQAKNGARFWCHVSAMTFIQMAAALGYQGRLVSLSRTGYVSEHAVAEFWSNYYQKWVMIDPDFNIWYTKNGTPLNVLEIHNTLMKNEIKEISIVCGKNRPIHELEKRLQTVIYYYKYFDVDMRNDWLTNHYFPGHPARSDKSTLLWNDNRLAPLLHFKTEVNEPDELYWDLNRTHISFGGGSSSTKTITVYLDTCTPNFSDFEILIDNTKSISIKSNQFQWTLHSEENSIKVRSVNSLKQKGIPSEVIVFIG